ncbi:MAG: beta-galactosidase [Clostridium sp.]|nr:beta-galactosidase [Clostridium sp.]
MEYRLSLKELQAKRIYPLGEDFQGTGRDGEEISFTNYYMEKNGRPFFGVSGEFHFSRMNEARWEDELIKMKLCGVNMVATYVFWIHHEEEEGVFDFSGRRDIRRFVELCAKHGLYVILRVGPFDHGEVRNGGLPDWLYGKPFEVRKISRGFFDYTERLYRKVAGEVSGMFYKDGGPIIGVQIDNEYMHSSAPWEITTGISNEWVFTGDEGEEYMLKLKALAAECGLTPVFYTCTGWGGTPTPKSMMPLWGGYAFRPWIFYSHKGEHPATEEYVYQDFHNDKAVCTNDFKPAYPPEEKPYACCEMGGGMGCSYYYRFQFPFKSVDAMANIKIASGCNFLGYYMFQGGSNPVGKSGIFMNEGQVPKISYDYQAALGEFGQIRESYRRLKCIHYFVTAFAEKLCGLKTILPEGASDIDPKDSQILRYAVRTDGKRGFLFINNYQDHAVMPDRHDEEVTLELSGEDIRFSVSIAEEENAILPFHFDMDGIDLIKASAQPLTVISHYGEKTYVFFVPEGMEGEFAFEEDAAVNGEQSCRYVCAKDLEAERFYVEKGNIKIAVLVLGRKMAEKMFCIGGERLLFADGAVLEDESGIRLETTEAISKAQVYPADVENSVQPFIKSFQLKADKRQIEVAVNKVSAHRYTIDFPKNFMAGLKDAVLQLDYAGDIGHAFIDGRMIHDNFCNGAPWEIGLREFAGELADKPLTIYITPLKKGARVHAETAMAARTEEAEEYIGELKGVRVVPVYEAGLDI